MIFTYLYDLDEIDKMADGMIVSLDRYSFNDGKLFTKDEILSIKESTKKAVILDISALYHDRELSELKIILKDLKSLDYFLFQDFSLIEVFRELGIINKAIYAPETFITNHLDQEFFKDLGINKLLISREITKDDILSILKNKGNTKYAYQIFGYIMMFYSYRKHFTNYNLEYNLNLKLKNRFDLSLKEETRDEKYRVIEDDISFRIYRDKIFDGYSLFRETKEIDYLILNRIFIPNDLYFDTLALYKGELDYSIYLSKYNDLFDSGFLYREIGLLKGDVL